jgi:hypothetical protein
VNSRFKHYKDSTQVFGRPRKYTALEEYAIFREWEERGNMRPEVIALKYDISMGTLMNYVEKYKNKKNRKEV